MKKQSATPTQAALMKRPTPTQAAQAAHAKFGILVIPVDTEPLAGDVTCSYGQAPTRMLFRGGTCSIKGCSMTLVTYVGAGQWWCWLHALVEGLEVVESRLNKRKKVPNV